MKTKLNEKILSLGLIAVSILSIIFAILCWSNSVGFYEGAHVEKKFYGGDAYTGIQQAAAVTANNITVLSENLAIHAELMFDCMGYFLFVVGATLMVLGVVKAIDSFKKEKIIESQQNTLKNDLPNNQ
jgi:hypothetical protein